MDEMGFFVSEAIAGLCLFLESAFFFFEGGSGYPLAWLHSPVTKVAWRIPFARRWDLLGGRGISCFSPDGPPHAGVWLGWAWLVGGWVGDGGGGCHVPVTVGGGPYQGLRASSTRPLTVSCLAIARMSVTDRPSRICKSACV